MVTNYHIIDDNFLLNNKQLKICLNGQLKIINLDENCRIYSSITNKFDLMIIKLKKGEINKYLELEQNLFIDNAEKIYQNELIFVLHYPNGDQVSVSLGIGIERINEFDIKHQRNSNLYSSGGPILSLHTNKIIGIHKGFINQDFMSS